MVNASSLRKVAKPIFFKRPFHSFRHHPGWGAHTAKIIVNKWDFGFEVVVVCDETENVVKVQTFWDYCPFISEIRC